MHLCRLHLVTSESMQRARVWATACAQRYGGNAVSLHMRENVRTCAWASSCAIHACRESNIVRIALDHTRHGLEHIQHASPQTRQSGMNRSELPMTSSEPGRVDVIESHAGIEYGQGFEVPVTAPQFGGHQVVISTAATDPWDAFNGRGTTVEPMKIVVIGATGTIGTAVANALESAHQIVRASRHGPVKVDMCDSASVAALFESVHDIDAIVCCAASVKPTPLPSLCEGDVALALQAKLIGQVDLVRQALRHLRNGGSITLTAGAFVQPTYGRALGALVNAGVRCFVRAAAAEMPRSLRLNVVSPACVKETLEKLGLDSSDAMPARDVARAYVVAVEGMLQGQTIVPTAL